MGIKQDLIAALGEFVGTTLFLMLALGGAKTAQYTRTSSQTEGLATSLGNQTIMFIAVSFGLSLLVTAYTFFRVTGGLFNPAITFSLWLIGGVNAFRAILLVVAQLAGGIAGAGLVAALTPFGGADTVTTTLGPGVNIGQGLFIEAFLTASLVLTVLFLAAEKHRSTHMAPIGIGLIVLACHLFGVAWTGCGINPARSFGPAVVSATFPGYHWIYWVGPFIGALMSTSFYLLLKIFDYTSVVFGQDADHEVVSVDEKSAQRHIVGPTLFRHGGRKLVVWHGKPATTEEKGMSAPGDSTGEQMFTPATVAPFDADDQHMHQALRNGEASMLDPRDAEQGLSAIASPTAGGSSITGPPVTPVTSSDTMLASTSTSGYGMKSKGQNIGAILAPGSGRGALGLFPGAQNKVKD